MRLAFPVLPRLHFYQIQLCARVKSYYAHVSASYALIFYRMQLCARVKSYYALLLHSIQLCARVKSYYICGYMLLVLPLSIHLLFVCRGLRILSGLFAPFRRFRALSVSCKICDRGTTRNAHAPHTPVPLRIRRAFPIPCSLARCTPYHHSYFHTGARNLTHVSHRLVNLKQLALNLIL